MLPAVAAPFQSNVTFPLSSDRLVLNISSLPFRIVTQASFIGLPSSSLTVISMIFEPIFIDDG